MAFPVGFLLPLNTAHVLRYLFVLYSTNLKIFKNFDNCFILVLYIKQIMNVFIRAMVKTFSFGERRNFPLEWKISSFS